MRDVFRRVELRPAINLRMCTARLYKTRLGRPGGSRASPGAGAFARKCRSLIQRNFKVIEHKIMAVALWTLGIALLVASAASGRETSAESGELDVILQPLEKREFKLRSHNPLHIYNQWLRQP